MLLWNNWVVSETCYWWRNTHEFQLATPKKLLRLYPQIGYMVVLLRLIQRYHQETLSELASLTSWLYFFPGELTAAWGLAMALGQTLSLVTLFFEITQSYILRYKCVSQIISSLLIQIYRRFQTFLSMQNIKKGRVDYSPSNLEVKIF